MLGSGWMLSGVTAVNQVKKHINSSILDHTESLSTNAIPQSSAYCLGMSSRVFDAEARYAELHSFLGDFVAVDEKFFALALVVLTIWEPQR